MTGTTISNYSQPGGDGEIGCVIIWRKFFLRGAALGDPLTFGAAWAAPLHEPRRTAAAPPSPPPARASLVRANRPSAAFWLEWKRQSSRSSMTLSQMLFLWNWTARAPGTVVELVYGTGFSLGKMNKTNANSKTFSGRWYYQCNCARWGSGKRVWDFPNIHLLITLDRVGMGK